MSQIVAREQTVIEAWYRGSAPIRSNTRVRSHWVDGPDEPIRVVVLTWESGAAHLGAPGGRPIRPAGYDVRHEVWERGGRPGSRIRGPHNRRPPEAALSSSPTASVLAFCLGGRQGLIPRRFRPCPGVDTTMTVSAWEYPTGVRKRSDKANYHAGRDEKGPQIASAGSKTTW
jgi:hypothetical protein